MKRPKIERVKMIVQSPSDQNSTIILPYAVAWVAAQAIAKETHYAVVLIGTYGTARFRHDGAGHVEWNEKATEDYRGKSTPFAAHTQVCI